MKLEKTADCVCHVSKTKRTVLLQSSRVPDKKDIIPRKFLYDYQLKYVYIVYNLGYIHISIYMRVQEVFVGLLKSLHYVPRARTSYQPNKL